MRSKLILTLAGHVLWRKNGETKIAESEHKRVDESFPDYIYYTYIVIYCMIFYELQLKICLIFYCNSAGYAIYTKDTSANSGLINMKIGTSP